MIDRWLEAARPSWSLGEAGYRRARSQTPSTPNYPNRIRQIGYFAFFSAVIQGFGVKKRFHPLNFNGFHSNLLVRNDLRHFRPFHLGNPGLAVMGALRQTLKATQKPRSRWSFTRIPFFGDFAFSWDFPDRLMPATVADLSDAPRRSGCS